MFQLAKNELYRLFLSPIAWVALALSQIIIAYLFLTHIDYFMQVQPRIAAIPGAPGVTELVAIPTINSAAIVCLLIAPLITMRMLAEEKRNESFPLLLSSPLSGYQVVLGKYLGTFSFFIIMAIMISLMPLSLLAGSELDLLLLTSAVIGLVLLLASFTAIGLFLSSLTKQPAIAAISTFTSLFMLWILDWASNTQVAEPDSLFSWLSLLSHFQPMLQGELNSKDISYYLIVIASFILLTVKQLDAERINK
jgi:ABC-2 type transport system permease protein